MTNGICEGVEAETYRINDMDEAKNNRIYVGIETETKGISNRVKAEA